MTTSTTTTETIEVEGDTLLAKVKELVHQGNVRRIRISNGEGEQLVQIPLSVGVVGVLLLPVWAAIGAIAAVVTDVKVEVEREPD
jgi:hypothetical protein